MVQKNLFERLREMSHPSIHPVILCGGSGTRLWPVSRKSYPKQFTKLLGDESLFQAAVKRTTGDGFAAPVVVTGSDFRFVVIEQMAAVQLSPHSVLIEPEGRNTAPAILSAALTLAKTDPDALMLVAPSDHLICDDAAFRDTIHRAITTAQNGQIVTFGITPDRPETGYGWLELKTAEMAQTDVPVSLSSFVEKPDAKTAERLFHEGRYLWNAGIFLFTAQVFIDAFKLHNLAMLAQTQTAVDNATLDLSFTRLDPEAWSQLEDISIDYAVMEKADNLSVLPYTGAWSDLGDWNAIWREGAPDENDTVLQGPATAIECNNVLLRSESESQHIVGIGLENLIAIAMPDAVLVADKTRSQDVGKAVNLLRKQTITQADTLPRDYRPWGWYESLIVRDRFQVKRIHVAPGASLSLQSHHHRSEHWIVVEGTARVTVDDDVTLLTENQSVYIPLGAVHRMENPGKIPMVLIEVQTGRYLGEDDIIRYEDVYARKDGAKG